jgi:hypothetical protein
MMRTWVIKGTDGPCLPRPRPLSFSPSHSPSHPLTLSPSHPLTLSPSNPPSALSGFFLLPPFPPTLCSPPLRPPAPHPVSSNDEDTSQSRTPKTTHEWRRRWTHLPHLIKDLGKWFISYINMIRWYTVYWFTNVHLLSPPHLDMDLGKWLISYHIIYPYIIIVNIII